jgi:PPOX class probable F420-dependent enzyme
VALNSEMTDLVPPEYVHLLEEPNIGCLGTIRPDNTVQVNPMWFEYDGEQIRFTHTTKRAKYRNLQQNPSMAIAVMDPKKPTSYLEVRGRLLEVIPDPEGAFYVRLSQRYGNAGDTPPADKADRVILVMSVEKTTQQ